MTRIQLAMIRAALRMLPKQCRYHGDDTSPPSDTFDMFGREACCDSGVPAQRRKAAEAALAETYEPVAPESYTVPPDDGCEVCARMEKAKYGLLDPRTSEDHTSAVTPAST